MNGFFDDVVGRGLAADQELLAADDRTLRLAAPLVTAERVDKLLRYQQAWLAALRQYGAEALEAVAAAQREALGAAGLSAREVGELEAIVRDFCGKRWAWRMLERRYEDLRGKRERNELRGNEVDKLERLESELRARDALPALERRYGAEAIALLRAREEELLTLHQALGQALRPGDITR